MGLACFVLAVAPYSLFQEFSDGLRHESRIPFDILFLCHFKSLAGNAGM